MHTVALLIDAALTPKVVAMRERKATGASFDRNFMEMGKEERNECNEDAVDVERVNEIIVV